MLKTALQTHSGAYVQIYKNYLCCPRQKNKTKKKSQTARKEITVNTFLFFLLHALCWKLCAIPRIVSLSLLVDMLTQCFEFAVWRRQLICNCWQACRTQFCQPAVRGGWKRAGKPVWCHRAQVIKPSCSSRTAREALHALPPSQASSTRKGKVEKQQHGAPSKAN